ncbi:MAG: hypothetical protein HKN50_02815 [Gammaproteobacteria bacterium]|nr:hypothetical protein [Gammaproteobacteria bacterium]
MDIFEFSAVLLKLGLPMTVLSWLMFTWLHAEGKINITADRKKLEADLKEVRKSHKQERKEKTKQRKRDKLPLTQRFNFAKLQRLADADQDQANAEANIIFDRWTWFGGGFYGLAALWTFVVIETLDVFRFVFAFPGFTAIFEHGIISALVSLLVNQFTNIASAFTWFHYWYEQSVPLALLIAYIGYWLGLKIAQYQAA